jgi:asparagine synthase (glutamine-hydrolysing)
MCGICGYAGPAPRARLADMALAMHHRGPDHFGIYQEPGAGLGMCRLAILDTSARGHQPMSSPDGLVWLAYNGELYNFREERSRLEAGGVRFRSGTDTEVVLHLYLRHGDDFLRRMRGMFALAVLDGRRGPGRERLLLARDPFGVKPLLHARVGGGLLFASEMKAMLASGLVAPDLDTEVLPHLLVKGSIPQPATAVRGVEMLLPAHRLVWEDGAARIDRYWSLGAGRHPELLRASYPEQVAATRAALEESVRLQMVSDVPLGAFLSGGVDSSLLVAMMARHSPHPVRTFSVGFGAEGAGIDETSDAERVARFVGTDHTRVEVGGQELRDRITDVARALDQPTVDGVNAYLVSMAARRRVTVAISGTGGDELFAGYPWFVNMYRAARQERIDFALRYADEYTVYGLEQGLGLLTPEALRPISPERLLQRHARDPDELPGAAPLDRVSALVLRGYTQNQLLRDIDAVSMAHSLEVRVPFLDPVVADVALSLPDGARLHPDATLTANPYAATYRETGVKRILVDLGRELLPPDMDRQPKRGFGLPFGAWMKGPLRDVVEDTLSPAAVRRRGLFTLPGVAKVRESFERGAVGWPHPWILMMVELWCREVLDAVPGGRA